MARRDDKSAILLGLLESVYGRPNFKLERVLPFVERWTSEGKTLEQIARLLAEQSGGSPSNYFTVSAHYSSGGLFRAVEHVLATEIAATKKRLQREAKESLVYTLLSEGKTPKSVQTSLDFTPKERDSVWGWPTHRSPQQMGLFSNNNKK